MNSNTQRPGAWATLKQSIVFYRKHGNQFLLLAILPVLGQLVYPFLNYLNSSVSNSKSILVFVSYVFFLLIGGLAVYVVRTLYVYVLIKGISHMDTYGDTRGVSIFKTAWKDSTKLFFPIIWQSILVSLVIFMGMVLLVIPFFIISTYITLCTYVLVIENKRGMDSLALSTYYVRGNGKYLFGQLVKMTLFFGGLGIVLYTIMGGIVYSILPFSINEIPALIDVLRTSTTAQLMLGIAVFLFEFLANAFVIPIFLIHFYFIYKYLKVNKPDPDPVRISSNRKLFIWLASAGAIIAAIAFVVMFVVTAFSVYSAAKKEALQNVSELKAPTLTLREGSNPFESQPVSQDALQVGYLFPGTAEVFSQGDTSKLSDTVRKNIDLGIEMKIPKNWTFAVDSGFIMINPNLGSDALDSGLYIQKVDLPIGVLKQSEIATAESVFDALEAVKGIKDIDFNTYNINGKNMYQVTGTFLDYRGKTVFHEYYIVVDELQAFVLNIRSSQKDFPVTQALLHSAISTFKILK